MQIHNFNTTTTTTESTNKTTTKSTNTTFMGFRVRGSYHSKVFNYPEFYMMCDFLSHTQCEVNINITIHLKSKNSIKIEHNDNITTRISKRPRSKSNNNIPKPLQKY